MKKSDEEKKKELENWIQLINSGSELEKVEKIHKNELKKHHNKED